MGSTDSTGQIASDRLTATFARYVSLNVLGMAGISCYILADTFFVARGIGTLGLASLNLAVPGWNIMSGFGLMIGMGSATAFALSRADSKKDAGNSIFTNALLFAAIVSVILFFCGLFLSRQIATLFGAHDETLSMTATYLRTLLLFAPLFVLNDLLICFVRNDKAPRLAMLGMLIGSLANIVLDYIFIFPLKMGIFGAALATGISPVISLCILSRHFIGKHNTFHPIRCPLRARLWGRFFTLGFSSFINEVAGGLVIFVFNILILGIAGDVGVAAYGVVANIALVAIALFTGIAQGIQPLASSLFGHGRRREARLILRYALIFSTVLSLVIYLPAFFFATPLAGLFNLDGGETLTQLASSGIQLYFLCFIFAGVNIISAFYLSAIGHPSPSFVIMLLRGFVISIPSALLMSHFWGMTGVWLSIPVTEAIVCCISVGIMYRNTATRQRVLP